MKCLILMFSTSVYACMNYAPCIDIKVSDEKIMQHNYKPQRMNIINYAKAFIGIPYEYGGDDFHGIDCSAYVRQVYKRAGIYLPRTSREQFRDNRLQEVKQSEMRSGDLVFFKKGYFAPISHVAIYLGNNKIIHSSKKEGGVKISKITPQNIWGKRLYAIKRIRRNYETSYLSSLR